MNYLILEFLIHSPILGVVSSSINEIYNIKITENYVTGEGSFNSWGVYLSVSEKVRDQIPSFLKNDLLNSSKELNETTKKRGGE